VLRVHIDEGISFDAVKYESLPNHGHATMRQLPIRDKRLRGSSSHVGVSRQVSIQ
jgi:hypothetical protein